MSANSSGRWGGELLTDLLTRLATYTGDEIDAVICIGLQKIAEFIGGDHAYVITIEEEKIIWNISHEWHDTHISPIKHILQRTSSETFEWSDKNIHAGNIIKINTLDDYPIEASAERKFCEQQGILSVLNIPIIVFV